MLTHLHHLFPGGFNASQGDRMGGECRTLGWKSDWGDAEYQAWRLNGMGGAPEEPVREKKSILWNPWERTPLPAPEPGRNLQAPTPHWKMWDMQTRFFVILPLTLSVRCKVRTSNAVKPVSSCTGLKPQEMPNPAAGPGDFVFQTKAAREYFVISIFTSASFRPL